MFIQFSGIAFEQKIISLFLNLPAHDTSTFTVYILLDTLSPFLKHYLHILLLIFSALGHGVISPSVKYLFVLYNINGQIYS